MHVCGRLWLGLLELWLLLVRGMVHLGRWAIRNGVGRVRWRGHPEGPIMVPARSHALLTCCVSVYSLTLVLHVHYLDIVTILQRLLVSFLGSSCLEVSAAVGTARVGPNPPEATSQAERYCAKRASFMSVHTTLTPLYISS